MEDNSIIITGSTSDITGLRDSLLSGQEEYGYRISDIEVSISSIETRDPLGQAELVDIIISFVTGVLSNLAHEYIRTKIKDKRERHLIKVRETHRPTSLDHGTVNSKPS